MIACPEIALVRIAGAVGRGEPLVDLAFCAADSLGVSPTDVGGVVAATFSNPQRFPALAVEVAAHLGLPASVPAFDLQMACSAYPYAVYLAGRLAGDLGRPVLVIDGDAQSPLVDASDHATGHIFSDAVTATLVRVTDGPQTSRFDFMTRRDEALTCPSAGPIRMDGFRVFSFVATDVSRFIRGFLAECGETPDFFAPHQAQPYMVRQLAKVLGLSDRLLAIDETLKNPGSCSVAMALAAAPDAGRALIAGFGAGYSAAVGLVRLEASAVG